MLHTMGSVKSKIGLAVLTLAIVSYNTNVSKAADRLGEQEKALKIIADSADRICKDIPLVGQGNNLELSGQAKAELSGVIKKLADLGVTGTGKYQQSEYQGVLQKDLAEALKKSTDCKLVIWNDLKDKLLVEFTNQPQTIRYEGRVIDSTTKYLIQDAKVSLDLQGVSPVYTDSEGIYSFTVRAAGKALVRVDAKGYKIYNRFIELAPGNPKLEDIRLEPIPRESSTQSTSLLISSVSPQKRGNYSFNLQSCKKNVRSVECSIMIRNDGPRDKFYIWGSSKISDSLNKEVMISRASIGSRNRTMNRHSSLANDIPLGGDMLLSLHFDGVTPEANKIRTLEIDSRGNIGVVTFSDIPLSN